MPKLRGAIAGWLIAALLPGLPLGAKAAERGGQPLNVLLITVDDLNTSLGCYGARIVRSPNIDRLAARALRFDRAYCQFPVCNPSRVSMFTGRYPETTRVLDNQQWFRDLMPDVVTLPQHFRAHGYTSARFGKLYHGGYDDAESWSEGGEPFKPKPPRTPAQQEQMYRRVNQWTAVEGDGAELPDSRSAAEASKFLERQRAADRPFFLAVGFHRPHVPLAAPKRYFDHYPPASIPLPADFAPAPAADPTVPAMAYRPNFDLFFKEEKVSPAQAREAIAAYYASLSFMDEQVGRVLDALDRLELRDRTVIVFVSDHGWHLGDKGMWAKATLFEASARVPLIIDAPSLGHDGKSCERIVELVDLYPTLVELCGLPMPEGLEGSSLLPLMKDPAAPRERPGYTVMPRSQGMGRSIRSDRWRYTEWNEGQSGAELYDHQRDPGESRNLADDPAHQETRQRLKRVLASRAQAAR